mmetsp:Transcript_1297/g.1524  ORF Transcript_1297/g.1524 Transcript_1297/m.1524 type:complete len:161 (-) Transcript_1297:465-947(-)
MKYISAIFYFATTYVAMASSCDGDDLAKVDQWLATRPDLNEYGDPKDTMYMGGSPLFNEMTGEMTSKCDYLKKKFPDEPWKKDGSTANPGTSGSAAAAELAKIDTWLEKKGLNKYGDPEDTMYMGGTPLFNEMTGVSKSRIAHLLEKFPDKPWNSSGSDL